MRFLLLRAYWNLVIFDLYLCRGNFAGLYGTVGKCAVDTKTPSPGTAERVCSAVNLACIWYWKQVLCLQRSAATTCLLRQNGVPAKMVIGAQHVPFRAHAWVEIDGRIINDRPYTPEIYTVVDRC